LVPKQLQILLGRQGYKTGCFWSLVLWALVSSESVCNSFQMGEWKKLLSAAFWTFFKYSLVDCFVMGSKGPACYPRESIKLIFFEFESPSFFKSIWIPRWYCKRGYPWNSLRQGWLLKLSQ